MKTFLLSLFLAAGLLGAIPGTVPVPGPIAPQATNSPYPAVETVYIKGGVWTGVGDVSWLSDFSRYPPARRQAGQLAILTDGSVYQLGIDLVTWLPISLTPQSLVVDSIADLANLSTFVTLPAITVLGYYQPGDGGGGTFIPTLASSFPTNLGTVIAAGPFGQYLRSTNGLYFDPAWFGAMPNDGVDDTRAITNCVAVAGSTPVILQKGRFTTTSTIDLLANTAAGIGISGRSFRGTAWHGTGVTNNPLSFEHTTIQANHFGPIFKINGSGAELKNLNLIYSTFPSTNDTTASCVQFGGRDTVMGTFENLRFMNGYRAINAPNDGTQVFSCIFRNIHILGFRNTGISLQAPGTQGLWENIYITSSQDGPAAQNYSEVTTTIATTGSQCVFTLTPAYAQFFTAGMLVQVSESDSPMLNALHSITDVGPSTITIDFATPVSPIPTTARISKLGGSSVVTGYSIECNQFREDEWINLNVEWTRYLDGKGCLFGDRTIIIGLHMEGLGFGSTTSANGAMIRGIGALNVIGWDLFNSFVQTNQAWHIFGASTTNSFLNIQGGRLRDQYYNPGSTLGLISSVAGSTNNFAFYDYVAANGTVRFNRSGTLTGVNYGKKFVSAETGTGKVTIGNDTSGNVLELIGGASGVRHLYLIRPTLANAMVGLGAATDGLSIFNETNSLGIAQFIATTGVQNTILGFNYTTTSPNTTISGAVSTGTADLDPGNLTILPPAGNGNATGGGRIQLGTPDATTSGTTSQPRSTKVIVKKEGQFHLFGRATAPTIDVTAGDVYFDTGTNKLRIRNATTWTDNVTADPNGLVVIGHSNALAPSLRLEGGSGGSQLIELNRFGSGTNTIGQSGLNTVFREANLNTVIGSIGQNSGRNKYSLGTALTAPSVIAGSGTPAGVVTDVAGSIYLRTDGAAGTSLYVKESSTGSSGWVPAGTGVTLLRSVSMVQILNTVTETSLFAVPVTIPADSLTQDADTFTLNIPFRFLNDAGPPRAVTFRIKIGGITVFEKVTGNLPSAAAFRTGVLKLTVMRSGATSAIGGVELLLSSTTTAGAGRGSFAVAPTVGVGDFDAATWDWATPVAFDVTAQFSNSSPTIQLDTYGAIIRR